MDKEPEEMQNLGVVGIVKEAYKIMRSYGRLLSSLTTTLVLPLCFALLAHHLISDPLLDKITRQELVVEAHEGTPIAAKLEHKIDLEMVGFFTMVVVYILFVLAFSLLAFAAIVYSVACIYTGKGVSYVKVLSVVPKVWKRLMVTFLWAYLIMFLYQLVFGSAFLMVVLLSPDLGNVWTAILLIILLVAFLVAFIGVNMIWNLASVVSVLEEIYGLGAVKKSVQLLKGKVVVVAGLMCLYAFPNVIISTLFQQTVVHSSSAIWWRTFNAAFLISCLAAWWMMGIIVQSIIYFVCKAYHHESIDRYALSDHLDGYLGEYMPLKDPIPMETLDP